MRTHDADLLEDDLIASDAVVVDGEDAVVVGRMPVERHQRRVVSKR